MSRLIVKDGRLCIVGGQLVTSDGGAPCVCRGVNPGELGPCLSISFPGLTLTNGIWREIVLVNGFGVTFRETISFESFSIDFSGALASDPLFQPGQISANYTGCVSGFMTQRRVRTTTGGGIPDTFEETIRQSRVDAGYSVTLELFEGFVYVASVSIVGFTPDASGIVFEHDIFRFSNTDTDIPYFNADHPEPYKNTPRITDLVPNLNINPFFAGDTPQPTLPDGTVLQNFSGSGGSAAISLINDAECISDKCKSGIRLLCGACDGSNDTYVIDADEIPPFAVTFRVGARRYYIGGTTTPEPAMPVDEYLTDPCPGPPGPDFAIAVKCSAGPEDDEQPDTIVYSVNQSLGAGNGSVSRVIVFTEPCPAPQPPRQCQRVIFYRPTTTPAAGPSTPLTSHFAGVACSQSNFTICASCGSTFNPQRGSAREETMTERANRLLAEQGFDPDREARSLKQGGDCGCSRYTYEP